MLWLNCWNVPVWPSIAFGHASVENTHYSNIFLVSTWVSVHRQMSPSWASYDLQWCDIDMTGRKLALCVISVQIYDTVFTSLFLFYPQKHELLLNASVNCLSSLLGFLQRKSPSTGTRHRAHISASVCIFHVSFFFPHDLSSVAFLFVFFCFSCLLFSLMPWLLAGFRHQPFSESTPSRIEQNWTELIPVSHPVMCFFFSLPPHYPRGCFSVCLCISEVRGVSALESIPPLLSAQLRRELPPAPCHSQSHHTCKRICVRKHAHDTSQGKSLGHGPER